MCGDVFHVYIRRTALFDPLCEKPAEVFPRRVAKYPLQILPIGATAPILCDELLQRPPERLVADLLPEQMKYHRGLLIADGVVALIVFLRELSKWIIAVRRHLQVISTQHEPPLIPCLVFIARPLVPIVVGQIRRQAFNPISLLYTVEHGISDPGMHDLMTQGIGLNIVTLDHAAPEQGK